MVDADAVVDSERLIFVGDIVWLMDVFVVCSEGFVNDSDAGL
jgi:hypothetical protein